MKVADYYENGKRCWLQLHEKGGKFYEVSAHRNAENYLDEYLTAAILRWREAISPLPHRGRPRRRALYDSHVRGKCLQELFGRKRRTGF